jgi:succinate dehydrogenase / fumarate reductase membrane anchor subunit
MTSPSGIGSRRKVVGAHYGLRDWMAQRASAVLMAVYTVILLGWFLTAHHFSYEGWASIFAIQWMKCVTFAVFCALFYHAWVGMREIAMDYLRPMTVRLVFYVLVITWLLACAGYIVQILWSV